MNPADVPPKVFVESALKAMAKANIEATVIYVVDKNGKRVTRAESNNGPVGMARHLASVRIQDGAIERAAIGIHEFRLKLPDDIDEAARAEMDRCPLCGEATSWSALTEPDRDGHREIVKVVLGHALSQVASTPLVSV